MAHTRTVRGKISLLIVFGIAASMLVRGTVAIADDMASSTPETATSSAPLATSTPAFSDASSALTGGNATSTDSTGSPQAAATSTDASIPSVEGWPKAGVVANASSTTNATSTGDGTVSNRSLQNASSTATSTLALPDLLGDEEEDADAETTPAFGHPSTGGELNAAASSTATTTVAKTPLTCTMAYTADLYDTPSGHLDDGYVLAPVDAAPTKKKKKHVAHLIGAQSWTVCHNAEGKTFELKIDPVEYEGVSKHDEKLRDKEI